MFPKNCRILYPGFKWHVGNIFRTEENVGWCRKLALSWILCFDMCHQNLIPNLSTTQKPKYKYLFWGLMEVCCVNTGPIMFLYIKWPCHCDTSQIEWMNRLTKNKTVIHNYNDNKKVLPHERGRHTDRGVSSTHICCPILGVPLPGKGYPIPAAEVPLAGGISPSGPGRSPLP